jgi:hypothetical protein
LYVPAAQLAQVPTATAPDAVLYVPVPQEAHEVSATAPRPVEYLPDPQRSHTLEPVPDMYDPAEHWVHVALPLAVATLPAAQ